jgi:nucleoside 2-deoxyribosyltransferase
MANLRVYLSGKMSNRYVEDVKAERSRATEELNKHKLVAVDPAAAEAALWPHHKKAKISTRFTRKVMEAMVSNDLFLIRRCDVLLYLTGDVVSEGSILELQYAQTIGIPVVMVSPERHSERWMGWLNIIVPKDHTFPDIKKAVRFIYKRYQKAHEKNREYFNLAIRKRK